MSENVRVRVSFPESFSWKFKWKLKKKLEGAKSFREAEKVFMSLKRGAPGRKEKNFMEKGEALSKYANTCKCELVEILVDKNQLVFSINFESVKDWVQFATSINMCVE